MGFLRGNGSSKCTIDFPGREIKSLVKAMSSRLARILSVISPTHLQPQALTRDANYQFVHISFASRDLRFFLGGGLWYSDQNFYPCVLLLLNCRQSVLTT